MQMAVFLSVQTCVHNGTVVAMPQCCAKWKMELDFLKWEMFCFLFFTTSSFTHLKWQVNSHGNWIEWKYCTLLHGCSSCSACGLTTGKMMISSVARTLCDGSCWWALWYRGGPARLSRGKAFNFKGMTTKRGFWQVTRYHCSSSNPTFTRRSSPAFCSPCCCLSSQHTFVVWRYFWVRSGSWSRWELAEQFPSESCNPAAEAFVSVREEPGGTDCSGTVRLLALGLRTGSVLTELQLWGAVSQEA